MGVFDAILKQQYPGYESEYKFHPERRWKFDHAWPHAKVALEIEGGVWVGGRHTSGSGFLKDMEKYNAAGLLGWRVFRATPQQVKNGQALELVRQIFIKHTEQRAQKWKRCTCPTHWIGFPEYMPKCPRHNP